MKTVLIAVASLIVGFAFGAVFGARRSAATIRRLQRSLGRYMAGLGEAKKPTQNGLLRSVTRLIFVTTQISALVWVFTSYGIAIYSTVFLQQVYTMAELSEPAIHTILGVSFLKVLENVFEHNEGVVFGRSKQEETLSPETEDGEEV